MRIGHCIFCHKLLKGRQRKYCDSQECQNKRTNLHHRDNRVLFYGTKFKSSRNKNEQYNSLVKNFITYKTISEKTRSIIYEEQGYDKLYI